MADANNTAITISKISCTPVFLPSGHVVQRKTITYMVGTHGPFTYQVPQGQDDPSAIRNALEAEATKTRTLISMYPATQ